jgi:hypothetical protein
MIDIIQIFKSVQRFTKTNYETCTLQREWEDDITSGTGFLKDRILYLPDTGDHPPDIQDAKTLLIQDIQGFDPFFSPMPKEEKYQFKWFKDSNKRHQLFINHESICFYKLAAALHFEVFTIQKKQDGFELFLNYTSFQLSIGTPERVNHKIAEIKPGQPVRYRLNGKSDFSLSGRRERTFAEYDFIFVYAGQADSIVFKDPKQLQIIKVPPGEYKLVDERKILK